MNPYGVLNKLDEDSVDPCSWAMITCSPDNLVICLGAPSQSLSGTLSGAIGNLTNLRQVLLQNNNISGQIPPELGTLSKLQTLDLSNNRFSSVVPDSLGQLNSLQYLDLSYNNLSGPVPKSPARTFNVAGNPLICGSSSTEGCSGSANVGPLSFSLGTSPVNSLCPSLVYLLGKHKSKKLALALGLSLSLVFLFLLALGILWLRRKHKGHLMLNVSG
ncbi:hypothetical protein D5086_013253 [Populus alba]|uniref:Uncharacterized protein n=1 Tax=Populus alba TaxID=43335 RepID=A0ACC4C572_POPAL